MVSSSAIWFLDLAPGRIWPREQFQRLLPEGGCDSWPSVASGLCRAWMYFESKVQGVETPSQVRYVGYVWGLIWIFSKNSWSEWQRPSTQTSRKTRLKDCYGSKQRWKSQVCCTTVLHISRSADWGSALPLCLPWQHPRLSLWDCLESFGE